MVALLEADRALLVTLFGSGETFPGLFLGGLRVDGFGGA